MTVLYRNLCYSEGSYNEVDLNLVNDDVHTKFGLILSIFSKDIE